jgi:asparagine synthase (glutamine-hydrolysing)
MLRGAFAIAMWDEAARALVLARDCGYGKSLFFHRGGDAAIFASNLPDLLAHRDVPRQLDEIALASFLLHDQQYQRTKTFFAGVERVPSRHVYTLSAERTLRRAYWSPRIADRPLYRRDEDYIARGRELLDQAVARAVSDQPNYAVLASGGLDSAAVAATLARQSRADITCYTAYPERDWGVSVPLGAYADERPKTEVLAAAYPALRFRYVGIADLVRSAGPDSDLFPSSAAPSPNISRTRLGRVLRQRVAADGFAVCLVGMTGNLGLSWNGTDLLARLMREMKWISAWREAGLTARRSGAARARVLAREVLLPAMPRALRRALRRRNTTSPFSLYGNCPLRAERVAELGLDSIWRDEDFDPLFAWPRAGPEQRATWLFDNPQAAQDRLAARPGARDVEVRDPLADRDLLEFTLNVPATLFRRDGVPRWFARAVLADRVPSEILEETRRGSQQGPKFEALSARRAEIAAEVERMAHSPLASRLFDVPRLKYLVANWPKDAAEAERRRGAYMLSLEQAVHVFQFMRWATQGNV